MDQQMPMAKGQQPAQAPQDGGGQDQGSGLQQLTDIIGKALAALQKVLSASKSTQAEAQMAGQLLQGFQDLLSQLEQDNSAPQGGQGVAPVEAGAQDVKPAL